MHNVAVEAGCNREWIDINLFVSGGRDDRQQLMRVGGHVTVDGDEPWPEAAAARLASPASPRSSWHTH